MDFRSKYWFAIFPYLKTSKHLQYKNLTVRDSEDLENIPDEIVGYIDELTSMFYLRYGVQIKKLSFAYHISEKEVQSPNDFIEELNEFQTLLCFIYSSPHPTSSEPFFSYEHSSYFLFRPTEFSKSLIYNNHNVNVQIDIDELDINDNKEIAGYEGKLNNKTMLWVTHRDKIFPPVASMWLNIPQDLHKNFSNSLDHSSRYYPVVNYFARRKENDELGQRVLTSINWYNRSLLMDIEDEVALVNLAIAFECLLNLDQGNKITERFKETVNVLLGGFPRLESWLEQFYDARSEIMHEGQSKNLSFVPTDNPSKNDSDDLIYRPLVSYGRKIFIACVTTILSGARISKKMNLSSQLVTNKQRIEKICRKLSKNNGDAKDRILSVSKEIREIETYRFVPEKGLKIDQLIGVLKLLTKQYLLTGPDINSKLINNMRDFSKSDVKDHLKTLSNLNDIVQNLDDLPSSSPNDTSGIFSIVRSLIDSIWHYVFRYYFQLKQEQS